MSIYIWALELFLLLLFIHSVNAIINPDKIIQWTIDRYKSMLNLYGFECEIKPTAKSAKIIRYGHLVVAVVLLFYIMLLLAFGLKY